MLMLANWLRLATKLTSFTIKAGYGKNSDLSCRGISISPAIAVLSFSLFSLKPSVHWYGAYWSVVFSKGYNASPCSGMAKVTMCVMRRRFNEDLATRVTSGRINVTWQEIAARGCYFCSWCCFVTLVPFLTPPWVFHSWFPLCKFV
jgi:hypothetical protein